MRFSGTLFGSVFLGGLIGLSRERRKEHKTEDRARLQGSQTSKNGRISRPLHDMLPTYDYLSACKPLTSCKPLALVFRGQEKLICFCQFVLEDLSKL